MDEALEELLEGADRLFSTLTGKPADGADPPEAPRAGTLFTLGLWVLTGLLLVCWVHFLLTTVGLPEVAFAFRAGLLTLGRVVLLVTAATLIWTPIGVAIGFRPRLARVLQPGVLVLASFPALSRPAAAPGMPASSPRW